MTVTLWVIFTVMVAVAVVALAIPIIRRYDAAAHEGETITDVIRGELEETDRQVASGQLDRVAADAVRTELKRRLLVEQRARPIGMRLMADKHAARLAIILSAVSALVVTGLYAVNGRPDLGGGDARVAVAAEVASAGGAPTGEGTTSALTAQLAAKVAQNPADVEGWRLLGTTYFATQRFDEAATAFARAAALKPKDATLLSAQGEALTQAAGGVVTPPAVAVFGAAHALDAADPRARYFLALARDQHGEHAAAITDWVALLNDAPPDAPWAPELQRFVEKAASEARISLAGKIKPITPVLAGAANARGPDAAAVTAASGMTDEARSAFIRGMVDNLAAKLAANPRDADGWIRLIRARKVMGDAAAAQAALNHGRAAFADQPAVAKSISDTAATMGVS